MAVASRRDGENAGNVAKAPALSSFEVVSSFQKAKGLRADRRNGLDAVPIGVVADAVSSERLDHIGPSALLQHARLLADNFECSSHS